MIADTAFIIDLGRGDSLAANKLSELRKRKEAVAITAVTSFEFFQGYGNFNERELKMFSRLISNALIVPIDHEEAKLAGMIQSRLRKKGIQADALDCLIAGTVMAGKDILLTRNVKDFSHIEGLKIEIY
mgnify:CR=1 FL=1